MWKLAIEMMVTACSGSRFIIL